LVQVLQKHRSNLDIPFLLRNRELHLFHLHQVFLVIRLLLFHRQTVVLHRGLRVYPEDQLHQQGQAHQEYLEFRLFQRVLRSLLGLEVLLGQSHPQDQSSQVSQEHQMHPVTLLIRDCRSIRAYQILQSVPKVQPLP